MFNVFAAPILLLTGILSLGAFLFVAYTVYIDQNTSAAVKMKMYILCTALIAVELVFGISWWPR